MNGILKLDSTCSNAYTNSQALGTGPGTRLHHIRLFIFVFCMSFKLPTPLHVHKKVYPVSEILFFMQLHVQQLSIHLKAPSTIALHLSGLSVRLKMGSAMLCSHLVPIAPCSSQMSPEDTHKPISLIVISLSLGPMTCILLLQIIL